MFYYKQIDRESGEILALQSSDIALLDNHETIRLEELTEEQYNQLLAEMEVSEDEELSDLSV